LDNYDFRYYPYLDTFRFYSPDTGTFSNFQPEGKNYFTLCSSDGSTYGWNYLVFDNVDKYFRHRGDTVYIDYLNINTHPSNCNYSEIHDAYILSKDCEWREDVRDYIYIGDYSYLNDNSSIEERIRLNKEYDEKIRIRRKSNNTEQITEELMSEIQRIGIDYFRLRQNIEIEREEATDELP
jgi:hypothetical protein